MSKLIDYVESIIDNRGKNPPYYSKEFEHPVLDNFLINGERYPDINKVKRFIDENVFKTFIRSYLKQDDIVITLVGNGLGNCSLVPSDNWVIIQNTIGLKTKSTLYNRYLYYYLKLNRNRIVQLDGGSSQPNVRLDNFLQLSVDFHSLVHQRSIADLLYVIDSKIELNNRINNELEVMAKTIYDYWFVQFDFPDANGKPYKISGGKMIWNEELKREIPEGWKVKKMLEVLVIKNGRDHKHLQLGSIPVYGSGGIMRYANESIYDSESILIPRKGTLGNLFYINIPFWCVDTIFYTIMKFSHSCKYLFYTIRAFNISSMNTGSAVPSMTTEILNNLSLVFPPLETLKTFDSIVSPIFQKKEYNAKENQQLSSLRDWLLPMLMNGQVKVKDTVEDTLSMAGEEKVNYQ